jgi:flagellar M-ring protein FliF
VPRSSQSVTTSSKTTEQNGTVTVQNNLPNADAGKEGSGSQESRQEETTNYEIGKTVRTLIREQPQIDRISLAVMVDGIDTVDAAGKRTWKPRDQAELDRITGLVRSAIGFDEKRGDHVEVVSMRFAEEETTGPDSPTILGIKLEKNDLMRLAQTALFGLIALLALLLVLRPMVSRIVMLAPAVAGAGGDGSMSLPAAAMAAFGAPQAAMAGGPGASAGQIGPPGGGNVAGFLADESMVNVAQIEGQMRASSLRKLVELVDKHPDETLTIIRGWMTQDNG